MGNNLTESTFFSDTPLEPIDDARLLSLLAAFTRLDAARIVPLIKLYRHNRPGVANHRIYQAIQPTGG